MVNTRIRVRGVFFHKVEATYRDNDVRIDVRAKERLFREPLFEVEIGETRVKGKKREVEEELCAKLDPKIIAIEAVNAFLNEVSLEVGSYAGFRIQAMEKVPEMSAPKIEAPHAINYLEAEEIIKIIEQKCSAYAVMSANQKTLAVFGKEEQYYDSGYRIVEGKLDKEFPFERGVIHEHNYISDLTQLQKVEGEIRAGRIIVANVVDGGVEQTKILVCAGDYVDPKGRRGAYALFVINTERKLFESIRMNTEKKGNGFAKPFDALKFAKGILKLTSQLFPNTYEKANCRVHESHEFEIYT